VIPENELGVIAVFSQQAEKSGFEIVSIHSEFPDAIVRKGEVEYRAEFEYLSSNFRAHKHNVRECDLVICWERDSKSILPILALSETGWENTDLSLPSDYIRELEYWKQRAQIAENANKRMMAEAEENSDDEQGTSVSREEFVAAYNVGEQASVAALAHSMGVNVRTAQRWVARTEEKLP